MRCVDESNQVRSNAFTHGRDLSACSSGAFRVHLNVSATAVGASRGLAQGAGEAPSRALLALLRDHGGRRTLYLPFVVRERAGGGPSSTAEPPVAELVVSLTPAPQQDW